jgi:hypothetical protein
MAASTCQSHAYGGDNVLNNADPTGLWNCDGNPFEGSWLRMGREDGSTAAYSFGLPFDLKGNVDAVRHFARSE